MHADEVFDPQNETWESLVSRSGSHDYPIRTRDVAKTAPLQAKLAVTNHDGPKQEAQLKKSFDKAADKATFAYKSMDSDGHLGQGMHLQTNYV